MEPDTGKENLELTAYVGLIPAIISATNSIHYKL